MVDFSYKSTSPANMGLYRPSINEFVFLSHYSLTNMVLIFLIPIFTMRLLSSEKKDQTIALLMTAPIGSWQICLGKFLAGLGITFWVLVLSAIYPLVTFFWVNPDLTLILWSYVGLFFLASCYVSIGLFCSALSSSLILSVSASVVLNISLWFLSQGVLISDGGVLTSVIQYLSVSEHLFSFLQGMFKLSSFSFFISVSGLFLFFSYGMIDSYRWR